ncbi:phage GP46 family protein [Gluconobacter morbifer]|uniref:phage GP46 family protein n=1 Tax=Gluconobacter morbifer TaxID=479935 RepID=UPI0002DCC4A6|nr:phage GP46 family protein [Gluconobacter morbifer]
MAAFKEVPVRGGDILIDWDVTNGRGDWFVSAGSLATAQNGYDTRKNAILLSLFTDRRAPDDLKMKDPRGWWGDTYSGRPIGSWLWLLFRTKITNRTATLQLARKYCLDALQWMIDDGIAQSITASVSWATTSILAIKIRITGPDGTTSDYGWLWRN